MVSQEKKKKKKNELEGKFVDVTPLKVKNEMEERHITHYSGEDRVQYKYSTSTNPTNVAEGYEDGTL